MPDFRSGVWVLSRKGPQDSCANEVLLRLTRSGQVFKNCDTLSRTTKILHRTLKLPGLVVSINSLKIVLNDSPQKYYINIIPKMTPFTEKKCESWGYSSSFTPPSEGFVCLTILLWADPFWCTGSLWWQAQRGHIFKAGEKMINSLSASENWNYRLRYETVLVW